MIGPGKSLHYQTWLESRFSWNKNLQRKQNCAAKSANLKENARKVESVFVIRAALWAENLGGYLEHCRSWKNTLRKLAAVVNTGGHSIRVLNEKSVRDGGNLFPLWLVILKSVWYSVWDTLWLRNSWPWAVVSYTLLAAVPWNGLEHSGQKAWLCV